MSCFVIRPSNEKPTARKPSDDDDQLKLVLSSGTAVFNILRGSLSGGGKGDRYSFECNLRCFLKTGREYLDCSVEAAILFKFELRRQRDQQWQFQNIEFDHRPATHRGRSTEAEFFINFADRDRPFGSIAVIEQNRTALAKRIGLEIGREKETIDIWLTLHSGTYSPVFTRVIHVNGGIQRLGPLDFLIRKGTAQQRQWTLRQEVFSSPACEDLLPAADLARSAVSIVQSALTTVRSLGDSLRGSRAASPATESVAGVSKTDMALDQKRPIWNISFEDIPSSIAFDSWNEQIANPMVHYLQNTLSGYRLSGLPGLNDSEESAKWKLSFLAQEIRQQAGSFSLIDSDILIEKNELIPVAPQWATLSFGAVTRHDGLPLQLKGKIAAPDPPKRNRGEAAFDVTFPNTPQTPRPDTPQAPQDVRIGSLDFTIQPPLSDTIVSTFRVARKPASPRGAAQPQENDESRTPSLRIGVLLFLPVVRVNPGGQDDLAPRVLAEDIGTAEQTTDAQYIADRFNREPPLVVPLPRPNSPRRPALAQPLTLRFTEDVSIDSSHSIDLSLEGPSGGGLPLGADRFLVIDRNPFLVAAVTIPEIRPANGPQFANWRYRSGTVGANQRQWEIRSSGGTNAEVRMPPQVVGEAMVKNDKDDYEGKTLDFRLSTPGRFSLRLARRDQSSFVSPLNFRRLFGIASPGASAGVELSEAEFELLYGLTTKITYPRPNDFEIPLRMWELASAFGAVPPHLKLESNARPEVNAYAKFWADVYARQQSRLGALEIRRENDIAKELDLSEWLSFKIRQADMADPVNPDGGKLKGGALWGFEFKAPYKRLLDEPDSREGFLRRPFMSALGGWGYQKATFASGIISIYSDAAMGRTSYYSVEQIGRIGCVHNKAKHVVVYERSVAPSPQFAPDQKKLWGRPIVRKVVEYVEIQQPRRDFPDTASDPRLSGFIKACEFKTKIIRVNSSWGSDVLNEKGEPVGFQVPLWRPAENSRVYPKPVVLFEMPTQEHTPVNIEPSGGAPADTSAGRTGFTYCEIREPEKLIFYSLSTQRTADTDQWPTVVGIDSSPLEAPMPVDNVDRLRPGTAMQNDDLPVEQGFDQFTFALVPGSDRVNLIAGRAKGGINAIVHNVTLARDSAVRFRADAIAALDRIKTLGFLEKYTGLVGEFRGILSSASSVNEAIRDQLRGAVSSQLSSLTQAVNAFNSLRTGLGYFTASNICTETDLFVDRIEVVIDGLDPGAIAGDVEKKLFPDPGATILDQHKKCVDVINQWAAGFSKQVAPLAGVGSQLDGQVTKLKNELAALERALRQEKDRQINEFKSVITQTSAALKTSTRTRHEILEEALRTGRVQRERLQSLGPALDAALERLKKLPEKIIVTVPAGGTTVFRPLDGILIGLFEDATRLKAVVIARMAEIVSAWAAADRALVNGLDTASMAVGGAIDGWRDSLLGETATVERLIQNLFVEPQGVFAALRDPLSRLETFYVNARAPFENLSKATEEIERARREAIAAVDQGFAEASDYARKTREKVQTAIQTGLAKAKTELNVFKDINLRPFAMEMCDRLAQQVDDVLTTINKSFEQDFLLRWINGLPNGLSQAIAMQQLDDWEAKIKRLGTVAFERLYQTAIADSTKLTTVLDEGKKAFRLLKAFGDTPILPDVRFNCGKLAYFFNDLERIGLNGVTGLVNRVGEELKPFSLQLPTKYLTERFEPFLQNKINLSDLFPNCAGLNLARLFQGIQLGEESAKWLKVTHGVDTQSRQAWLKAQIEQLPIPSSPERSLLNVGAFRVWIESCTFTAVSESRLGTDLQVQQSFQGSIKGHWNVELGKNPLITLRDVTLRYDKEGHLHFDIDFRKIELTRNLKFLTDALKTLSGGSGFTIRPFLPAGVRVFVDLEFPNVGAVTSGIQHLTLGFALELRAFPEFSLGLRTYLGRRDKPFVCAVFILGGTGWVDVGLLYAPVRGRLSLNADIAIGLSASLQIALGPISGQIGASLTFNLVTGNPGDPGVATLILRIWGEVQVLCIVSARIELILSASYSGNCLSATGRLKIHISICWFLEIDIDESITYSVGSCDKPPKTIALAEGVVPVPDPYTKEAEAYIQLLEECLGAT